ncbi:hypothetical protein [Chelativorans composti]|uniref:Uncharacterized protein n=1 Tax=Chelativorans composti TaxID=768533 RepID=A0ABW5DIK8_9HYPH
MRLAVDCATAPPLAAASAIPIIETNEIQLSGSATATAIATRFFAIIFPSYECTNILLARTDYEPQ